MYAEVYFQDIVLMQDIYKYYRLLGNITRSWWTCACIHSLKHLCIYSVSKFAASLRAFSHTTGADKTSSEMISLHIQVPRAHDDGVLFWIMNKI